MIGSKRFHFLLLKIFDDDCTYNHLEKANYANIWPGWCFQGQAKLSTK